MADTNSLGPLGPNILSVEAVSDLVYSVQGNNFVTGFRAEVRNGVGFIVEGTAVSEPTGTAFTLTLPYATPGPYTLAVVNPDGRTSTLQFDTPGTSASNSVLRANS
jgi:hypothetical protein